MFVNNVVKELLGGLENAGGGDDVKGTRILRGFLNNKRVGELVDRLLAEDEKLPGNAGRLQTDARMADRLAETVSLLKNKTSSLPEWHAYSSILTALTPSAESECLTRPPPRPRPRPRPPRRCRRQPTLRATSSRPESSKRAAGSSSRTVGNGARRPCSDPTSCYRINTTVEVRVKRSQHLLGPTKIAAFKNHRKNWRRTKVT